MPQQLTEFELQDLHDIVAQGFFNEVEKTFEQQVLTEGPGYYKCVYSKHDGNLISVTKVTEIVEQTFEQLHDRLVISNENDTILYVKIS